MNDFTVFSPISDNTETEALSFAWVPAGLAVFAVFVALVVWAVGALL